MVRALALLCLLAMGHALGLRSVLRMAASAPSKATAASAGLRLARGVAGAAAALALQIGDPRAAIAEQSAGASSVLESSIVSLEKATNRKEAVQALADVFEAAESKTLLVRTKYKNRIITAINEKHVLLNREWDQTLSYESGELKRRVDPYRTVDLKGYLQVAPFVGGAGYLGALFVQQALPELFIFAYPAAVFAFAAPIVFIVLST
jgi:hypothetical protein